MMRIVVLALLFLSACAGSKNQITNIKSLDQVSMLERSHSIRDVSYDLNIDLSHKEKYQGTETISFTLVKKISQLRVDFNKGRVKSIKLNDFQKKFHYNDYFILIDTNELAVGKHQLTIDYEHTYSKTAEGFYRFDDPLDGTSYVYTDFEPYNANKFFPSFDQPNLKATYKLAVLAPKDWKVVTSIREQSVKNKGQNKLWIFPTSQKFSTYILNLSAGNFSVWENTYQRSNGSKVPLRLFARRSLAKYVDHKEWFKITKQGMKFFEKYFAQDYPFIKYDQLIVPDFNWGGMENVGAVTYAERYVYKSAPATLEKERRANVILHELAHQWFGDLVTMKWWNGLWLNESFATVMANIALYEATEYKGAWQTFFNKTKGWAYWTDQLVTTHPIEVEVEDTETAFTNFDGITYGKGASVLKQLIFYLGDDFKKGIQLYFQQHAFKNTELSDFFAAMEEASGKDLDEWKEKWIMTAGLNTVEARFNCDGEKITRFDLIQTAPENLEYLRPHRTVVALFYKRKNGIELGGRVPVQYEGERTRVSALEGKSCPDIVYTNYEDHDYVKVKLDERTLATTKKEISLLSDLMTRTMIWSSLWDMVRDSQLALSEYIEIAMSNIEKETDYKIQSAIIDNLVKIDESYLSYLIGKEELVVKIRANFEKLAWENLNSASPKSDKQKMWYVAFSSFAHSKIGLANLRSLLVGEKKMDGLEMDQVRRWDILVVLNRYNFLDAKKLVAIEVLKDKTDYAVKFSIAAEAARPEKQIKNKWYGILTQDQSNYKFAELETVLNNLFPAKQEKLKKKFRENYFAVLPKLSESKEGHFLETFTESLVPAFCDQVSSDKLSHFVQAHKSLPVPVLKILKISKQENDRCMSITTKF